MSILPAPGAPRVLALAQLTNSIGDGAFIVTSALFFSRVVGLSPAEIGLGLTIGWATGFLAGVPLGHLADRRGPRGTAVLLAVATALSVGALLFVRSEIAFVLAVSAYATSQCGLAAVRQALLARLIGPAERTKVRAHLQATLNAGLAIGAAIGGVALYLDRPAAYLTVLAMDAGSFVLAALVLHRLPAVPRSAAAPEGQPKLAVLRDRPYAVIALLNAVTLLYMPLLSLVVPLWIVQRTSAPGWLTAALLVLNTVSVMLFQVRAARRVTSLATAARAFRTAGVVMLLACVAFALPAAGFTPWAAVAVLLLAAGLQVTAEMVQAAGSWEIGLGLAPEDKQGQYQGFFGSGTAASRMLGPALLTTLIFTWGIAGWIVLGGLFLLAGAAMGPAVRWAERTRTAPAAPAPQPAVLAAAA
jgi:MFS family permease